MAGAECHLTQVCVCVSVCLSVCCTLFCDDIMCVLLLSRSHDWLYECVTTKQSCWAACDMSALRARLYHVVALHVYCAVTAAVVSMNWAACFLLVDLSRHSLVIYTLHSRIALPSPRSSVFASLKISLHELFCDFTDYKCKKKLTSLKL